MVALCASTYTNPPVDPNLKNLAEELDTQLWGLLPGFHRLAFENGHVLLTLCTGNLAELLRQQLFEADTVEWNSSATAQTDWIYRAKAIARLCKPGTLLTASSSLLNKAFIEASLTQCGFVIEENGELVKARYSAAWLTKKTRGTVVPGTCVVVGAGLAGAAVANSLARRGWTVTVLDAASTPASGASSLPAGLLVPHTSPDDAPLSRLSRAGVRVTLQQTRALLSHGTDWAHTGVLQRQLNNDSPHPSPARPRRDTAQPEAASDWCYPASDQTLVAAGLPPDSLALWHAQAGWVKPAALVNAWLSATGITWRGGVKVSHLTPNGEGWQACNASGDVVAQADMVVISAGYASQLLASAAGAAAPDLQAIRGQVTFGLQIEGETLPPFAVNGHGGLITAITTPEGPMWLMGAGYERDVDEPQIKAHDHADNLRRLQTLLPQAANALADQFSPQQARGWAGIRCATTNRLPRVGRLSAPDAGAGLWLCTGMGSRGLSFAALCGELLAAQLHGEPLPIDSQLAKAMAVQKV